MTAKSTYPQLSESITMSTFNLANDFFAAVRRAKLEEDMKSEQHALKTAMRRKRARFKAEMRYRQEQIEQLADGAGVYDEDAESKLQADIPKFAKEEIRQGAKLGNGAFGSVYQVEKINLIDDVVGEQDETGASVDRNRAARSFMAKHYRRQNSDLDAIVVTSDHEARYAIKRIRAALVKDQNLKIFEHAMVDMATETRILASIPHHPNIIKLRGIAATGGPESSKGYSSYPTACFHEDYFLVLDRLYGTLEERIECWQLLQQQQDDDDKKRHQRRARLKLLPYKSTAQAAKMSADQISADTARVEFDRERLSACHDLASALDHLHRHRIIHRDLKPSNIGFNIRGDLTIFDFGLARQLAPGDEDELFKLTGFCGSPRYMAPEVGLGKKYNTKCDVYSFGLIAWQILTLQKPYDGCNIDDLRDRVWPGEGIPPNEWSTFPKASFSSSSDSSDDGSNAKKSRFKRAGPLGAFLAKSASSSTKQIRSISESLSISNRTDIEEMVHHTFWRAALIRPDMHELEVFFRKECLVDNHNSRRSSFASTNNNQGRRRRRSTFVFRYGDEISQLLDDTQRGADLKEDEDSSQEDSHPSNGSETSSHSNSSDGIVTTWLIANRKSE